MKDTIILGIESSCDETSASVVKNGRWMLSILYHPRSNSIKIWRGGAGDSFKKAC